MKPQNSLAIAVIIQSEEKGWKALYYAEEFAKDNGVPTMIHQKSGVVENEVLNEAARLKVDLIILAYPHKLSGQPRRLVLWVINSVTYFMLRF